MSDIESLLGGAPAYMRMSCAGITPTGVQAAIEFDPRVAAKIEAIMIVGRGLRDDEGRHAMLRLPPSLALAIIRVLESPNPLEAAGNMVMPPSIILANLDK